MCFLYIYYCVLLSTLSSYFFFFFLMIRRPPRSTPFPTRRSSDLRTTAVCCSRISSAPSELPGISTPRKYWPFSSPSISLDRKSTRLNSSHVEISYAVFCLKKKKKKKTSVHDNHNITHLQVHCCDA